MNYTAKGRSFAIVLALLGLLVMSGCGLFAGNKPAGVTPETQASTSEEQATPMASQDQLPSDEPGGQSVPVPKDEVESGQIADLAAACFEALDRHSAETPWNFPYIALKADERLNDWTFLVKAPYEYTLYRYWSGERLDPALQELPAFRTNPVWTSGSLDVAAIIPVFSDESRRLYYKDSRYVEKPLSLDIDPDESYQTARGGVLELFKMPEGDGPPAPPEEVERACKPLVETDESLLYPAALRPGDSADMEWSEGGYPFANLISLFSGNGSEYAELYDRTVLLYHDNGTELMPLAAHVYCNGCTVEKIWFEDGGAVTELTPSEDTQLNSEQWTLFGKDASSSLFAAGSQPPSVFVQLESGEKIELHNR